MNQKEQVFLNSCELILQQFSSKLKGHVYFLWRKGKKHVQSLKYQCSEDINPMKQTLSLSLKTYSVNGQMQKRYTHFSVFDTDGREVDHVNFDITEWKPELTQKKIVLGQCNLRIRIRRRVALQLQNFHRHSKTEIQESSQQSGNELQNIKLQKKQQLTIKQQLAKSRRELQDYEFLTNKLKNDRNFYITENQNLRHKLSTIHDQYSQQITMLKQHYQTRLEIRESIYEQQIQQLISTFNQNYEINRALIQGLVHEKYDYEAEINQMKEMHQKYITKQQDSYQSIISQLQQNKKQIEDQIKDLLNKISDKESNITELQKQLQETKILFDQTKDDLNKQIEQHGRDNQKWEKQLQDRQLTIYKRNQEIEAMNIQIDTKDFQLKENQAAMEHYRTLIAQFEKSIVEKQKMNHQIETERYNLTVEIQRLKVTIEEQTNQIEFHKASIQQLKQQDKIKQEEYLSQYRSLQAIYNEKQVMFTNQLKTQHEKFLEINKQNYDLNIKIQQLQHDISLLNDQVTIQKNDNQQNLQLATQLREEMKQQSQAFTKQYREYNQQIADLMSENNVLEAQNLTLKEEVHELQRKIQIDTEHLKKDYEDLLDSKVRLYEDELEFLKKQRDADVENFERLRKQYELQISSLIDRESKENEEMQKMFRDQMEMKNREFLEMKDNYRLMQETYDDIKLRLQITEQERDQLKKQMSSGKRPKLQYDRDEIQIQEIEEESQQVSEQDSQSEESQSSSDHRKKKNKKKTQKQKEKEKKKKKEQKRKKEQKKQKQKQKAKNKKSKKKKLTQSQSQSEEQESYIQDQQLSQDEPSQVLANIEDDSVFMKKQKNFVRANQIHGGSQRILQMDNDESMQEYGKKVFLPEVISIQVPMDEPVNNERKQTNKKQVQSVSSMKKRKDMMSESERQRENEKLIKAQEQNRQLQKQIKKLKKQIKQHQRTQTVYMGQIQELQEQVKSLNTQIDNLVKKVSKKDPKLAKNISAQIEQKRSQKSMSNKSRSQVSMRMPPIPRKQVQNMKMENQYLKRAVQEKNKALALIENDKNNLLHRLQSLQATRSEAQRRTGTSQVMMPSSPQYILAPNQQVSSSQIQQSLRKTIIQLENKLMSERQKGQQSKLQLTKTEYQKQQTQKENKKLKSRIQQVEEEIKKNQPTQSQRQMQKQLEDYGKQFLQMSKSLNSAKIQKQAFQQQLRLVKKRYSEIIRASQQAQTRASNIEREVEDLRRRQGKARRELEDYQDQVKKNKELIKNLQNQINQNNTHQTQNLYERKKLTDQIMKLQDSLSSKEFQASKLKKEIEKLKQKIQQGDQLKVTKRNDLLQQKQRLQSLLIKAQKKIQQFEDQERQLRQKIETLQRENRRNLQEKKSTYGDKLRFYVQEISNIKQIVDEYENQNSRLKIQNSELFEHNQILKLSFEKLQVKYEQLMENQEKLLQKLQAMQKDIDTLTQQITQNKLEIQASTITINNLRKQLDTQRTVSKKKSDKITAYQQVNEKYLYEIKTLKIKLSQFETNLNENQLLAQNIQKSTKTIQQLQHQLKTLQQEYNHVVTTYTYRKEDVEQAMRELKLHQQKIKEEQITRVIEQLDSSHSQKQASMEQQIIQLFNQNAKLRLTLHQKTQQNAQINLKVSQLQPFADKLKIYQRECENYERQVYELTQQLKNTSQELRRTQTKLNESIRNQEGKGTQNVILAKKLQDVQKKYKQLNESYLELKKQQKKLNERVKLVQQQRRGQVEKLTSQTLHYQNKILALELQVGRLKELQESSSKEYASKVRKLQQKIQQIGDTYKEHEQTLQGHYTKQTKKLQTSIQKLSEQLQNKLQRIQELNEALIMLQQENQELVAELTGARNQLAQESDIYTQNVNILRNQLKQAEDVYDKNIRILEEEMSMLNKELNTLKYNRSSTQSGTQRLTLSAVHQQNTNNNTINNQSKFRRSQQEIKRVQDPHNNQRRYDQMSLRRYEQKIKIRDRRIEQLKSQLVVQQQHLSKLIRKQSTQENALHVEVQKLKSIIQQKAKYSQQIEGNYQRELNVANEGIKLLKKQVVELRQILEQKEIQIQQNLLQLQSLRVQLKTTKQVYQQLQHELQKRKTSFNTQVEQQSHYQAQNRLNIIKINQLTQKLQQTTNYKNTIQTQLKRKSIQLKRLTQQFDQIMINYKQLVNKDEKKTIQLKINRQSLSKAQQLNDRLVVQNKRVKTQLANKDKLIKQLQGEIQLKMIQINHINLQVEDKIKNNTQDTYAKRYLQLQEVIKNEFNLTLEQYCTPQYLNQKLNEKDQDIQILAQQLEQLRFLNDHKTMEVDELKKTIYEMQMKTDQQQYYQSQIQHLKKLCDQLQQEKKDAVFREQALKLQLENIIESQDRNNITIKLQNILQMSIDV